MLVIAPALLSVMALQKNSNWKINNSIGIGPPLRWGDAGNTMCCSLVGMTTYF